MRGEYSGRVALDDYVDLVAKLRTKQGAASSGPAIPGRPGAPSQKKAVLGGATGSSSHTIDQEEYVALTLSRSILPEVLLKLAERASSPDISMAFWPETATLETGYRFPLIRCSFSTKPEVCLPLR